MSPRPTCPGGSRSTRSGRATACRTRRPSCRQGSRRSSSAGSPLPASTPSRRRPSCRPRGCRSSPTPRRCWTVWATTAGARGGRCSSPTSAASTGRSRPAWAPWPSSAAPRRRSRARTSTAPSPSRSRCSPLSCSAPRTPGLWVRAYVSMCFGDPWEGEVPIGQVVDVSQRLMHLGCDQLSLGDTIGVGTTGHVSRLLDALEAGGIGAERVGVHFHDTYGQALANTMTALRHGVTVVDASTGGLGAAPTRRARPATSPPRTSSGHSTGQALQTGVDLQSLVETSVWMAGHLGRPSLRRASCGRLPGRRTRRPTPPTRRPTSSRKGPRAPPRGTAGPPGDRGPAGRGLQSPGGSTGSAAFRRRCRAPGHPRRDRGRTTFAARRRCRRSSRSRPLGGRQRPLGAGRASSSGPCWAGQDRDGRRAAPAGMPRRPLPRAARR